MQRNARNLFIFAVVGGSMVLSLHSCAQGVDSCVETLTCPPPAALGAAMGGMFAGAGMGGMPANVANAGASAATGGATVMAGGGGVTGSGGGNLGGSGGNIAAGGTAGTPAAGSGGEGGDEVPCGQPVGSDAACMPVAKGVPGMLGPPQWSGVDQWATIDDPRWVGAMRQSFPNFGAASNDASLRGLSVGNTLYLSLQVLVDPDGSTMASGPPPTNWDSAFVGFRNPTSGQVSIVELDAKGSSAGDPHTILVARHWTKTNDAAAPIANVGSPAWASDLKLWEGAAAGATTIPWAINLKVDLSTVQAEIGTSSTAEAQIWYAFTIGHVCCSPVVDILTFHWPSVASPFDVETNPLAPVFPTSGWATLRLGTTDPSCRGVRISSLGINTTNTPSSLVRNDANNTFSAAPNWCTLSPVADLIEARFRIADWGSQVGANGKWIDMPGGAAAVNLANGAVEFTCNQSGSSPLCVKYVAPADHQCMLVELTPKGGSGISFLQDSAYRCMTFGTN